MVWFSTHSGSAMDGKRKFERKEQKEMNRYKNQLFEGGGTSSTAYDSSAYCDFSSASAKAIAGKDILVAFWNADGSKILAVAGLQSPLKSQPRTQMVDGKPILQGPRNGPLMSAASL